MINKIVTLDNDDKYLVFFETKYENNIFYVGVKIVDNKWNNDFKLFLEKKKDDDVYLELIDDSNFLKVLVNKYLLENVN